MRSVNVVTHYIADEFVLESDVRGFHVYRAAWTPLLGEELAAEREPGNSEDPFALKRVGETVGHVPTCLLRYPRFTGCLFTGAL